MNRRSFIRSCASFVVGCALAVGSLKRDEEDQNKSNPDYEFADRVLTHIKFGGRLYQLNPNMRFNMVDGRFVQVYPSEDGVRDLTLKRTLV